MPRYVRPASAQAATKAAVDQIRAQQNAPRSGQTSITTGPGIRVLASDGQTPVAAFGVADDGTRGLVLTEGGTIELAGGALVQWDDDGGVMVLYAGPAAGVTGSGSASRLLRVNRDDGTAAVTVTDSGAGLWDRDGNMLAGDCPTGPGLCAPWLPVATKQVTQASVPKTSSAAWMPLEWAFLSRWLPALTAGLLLYSDAGTVGRAQLIYTPPASAPDVQLAQVPIPAGTFGAVTVPPTPWPDDWTPGDVITLRLEVEVLSGGGQVGAVMFGGVQRS